MDLSEAVDNLYAVGLEDFLVRRTELVAAARAAGDRPLAKQIGALRKPTRTGWLVNLLARAEADAVAELMDLGAAFSDAQARQDGPELRALSQRRRTQVEALVRRAAELGAAQGWDAPDGARQEVSQTLLAAVGDPETADLVRAGHLTGAVTAAGFDGGLGGAGAGGGDLMAALAASLAAAPEAAKPKPEPKDEIEAPEPVEAAPDPAVAAARATAEAEVERANTAADEAREAAEQGEQDADEVTQRADDLADRIEALRTELRDAEEAERIARSDARAARKRHTELRQAAKTADRSALAARQALDELQGG